MKHRIFPLLLRRRYFSHGKRKPNEKIRNIGIIAHVDAGKTTVTERLLYLAGAIRAVGNVDKGNTVTDFLEIERERGITVQSAAVNFEWDGRWINLIDTPGHVDFRVEVERCVRVLDGIVCVIDGSAGVQPQTLTVWHQSKKFELPAIFFINKMDKKEANFANSLDSIEQKLGVSTIPTTVPFEGNGFLDILRGEYIVDQEWTKIPVSDKVKIDFLNEARSQLCYQISDNDEEFLEQFLDTNGGEQAKISTAEILKAIRRLTISNKIAPVTCGSAFRVQNCVRPILDSVVEFFPEPAMRNRKFEEVFGEDMAGLVFKITHDKRRGQLSYIRLYTGRLSNNSTIFNSSQMTSEGPIKLFIPYADELQPTYFVESGDIAVVSGLGNTVTGDTVLQNQAVGERAAEKLAKTETAGILRKHGSNSVIFAGIEAPEAVYFCCIEPPSGRKQQEFDRALNELTREDPSMKIRMDREIGQIIVETQGELHLEAIKDRLLRGYGLDCFIGKLQVAYREMLSKSVTKTAKIEDSLAEKKRAEFVQITMNIEPIEETKMFRKVEYDLPQTAQTPRVDWQKAINEGCTNALQNGPLASFPVHAVKITITEVLVSGGKVNPALVSACAQKCVTEALESAEMALIEPIMALEITVTSDEPTQPILNELIRRRARIEFSDRIDDQTVKICAKLPLAEMENLSRIVRTLTSGFGDMNVQICGYQEVPDFERTSILKRRVGESY